MTARNLQDKVKKQGLPWSAAKGFDTFTPIGSFLVQPLMQNQTHILAAPGPLSQNWSFQTLTI
jgi:2-keto-4-pentenoate hydratase/2-oxohepta-3-ene-1,7-dioic acid hydratase in catechol pathway